MNRKVVALTIGILTGCIFIGILLVLGLTMFRPSQPDTWEGIYRGTMYISDGEREAVGVIIDESDVRKIELSIKNIQNDVALYNVDNSIELSLEKTSNIFFSMKGASVPDESIISVDEIKDIYVTLEYIDEDTISIKYGETEAGMEACEPVKLQRSVS